MNIEMETMTLQDHLRTRGKWTHRRIALVALLYFCWSLLLAGLAMITLPFVHPDGGVRIFYLLIFFGVLYLTVKAVRRLRRTPTEHWTTDSRIAARNAVESLKAFLLADPYRWSNLHAARVGIDLNRVLTTPLGHLIPLGPGTVRLEVSPTEAWVFVPRDRSQTPELLTSS